MQRALSDKSRKILQAVADGSSYDEIVDAGLAENDYQIFYAAAEALQVLTNIDSSVPTSNRPTSYHERLAEIQAEHPKAYAPWTAEEDQELTNLHQSGKSTSTIAGVLQRQPGAIRSRLKKLGLVR